jgi:hypothetical protein
MVKTASIVGKDFQPATIAVKVQQRSTNLTFDKEITTAQI